MSDSPYAPKPRRSSSNGGPSSKSGNGVEPDEALLNDLLDGRLGEAGARVLRARIEREPALAALWQQLHRVSTVVRDTAPREEDLRTPVNFADGVRRRIASETPRRVTSKTAVASSAVAMQDASVRAVAEGDPPRGAPSGSESSRATTASKRPRALRLLAFSYAAAALLMVGWTVHWVLNQPGSDVGQGRQTAKTDARSDGLPGDGDSPMKENQAAERDKLRALAGEKAAGNDDEFADPADMRFASEESIDEVMRRASKAKKRTEASESSEGLAPSRDGWSAEDEDFESKDEALEGLGKRRPLAKTEAEEGPALAKDVLRSKAKRAHARPYGDDAKVVADAEGADSKLHDAGEAVASLDDVQDEVERRGASKRRRKRDPRASKTGPVIADAPSKQDDGAPVGVGGGSATGSTSGGHDAPKGSSNRERGERPSTESRSPRESGAKPHGSPAAASPAGPYGGGTGEVRPGLRGRHEPANPTSGRAAPRARDGASLPRFPKRPVSPQPAPFRAKKAERLSAPTHVRVFLLEVDDVRAARTAILALQRVEAERLRRANIIANRPSEVPPAVKQDVAAPDVRRAVTLGDVDVSPLEEGPRADADAASPGRAASGRGSTGRSMAEESGADPMWSRRERRTLNLVLAPRALAALTAKTSHAREVPELASVARRMIQDRRLKDARFARRKSTASAASSSAAKPPSARNRKLEGIPTRIILVGPQPGSPAPANKR